MEKVRPREVTLFRDRQVLNAGVRSGTRSDFILMFIFEFYPGFNKYST